MLNLKWVACGDHWCSLKNLDLKTVKGSGVYIIWHEGNPSQVVRVGQGDIAARLGAHREDPAIKAYAKKGTLRVTWASVSAAQRGGVEHYLADQLNPLVGDTFPVADPIAVNAPW